MTAPILPALTSNPRLGDHVETGHREESAMGDERLIEAMARAKSPGGHSALAAIRSAGYAIVPLSGEGFEAAVERAMTGLFGAYIAETNYHAWISPSWPSTHLKVRAALRAALSPGDQG